MPSHTSPHAIASVRSSDGEYITPVMWRANRLADALAKTAAAAHRLPGWVPRLVASASTWVKHQAAKLGAVTHAAKKFLVTRVDEEGASTKLVLRDSSARRPVWIGGKKRRKAAFVPGSVDTAPSGPSHSLGMPTAGDLREAAKDACGRKLRSGRGKKMKALANYF